MHASSHSHPNQSSAGPHPESSNEQSTQAGGHAHPSRTAGFGELTAQPRLLVYSTWAAQAVMALIYLQTLFFKFTYAPETQVIFKDLGGRLGASAAGMGELLTVVLLLIPRTAAWGALLSAAVMAAAIASHLLVIGIAVPAPDGAGTDGGALFAMAIFVSALTGFVLAMRYRQITRDVNRLLNRSK